MLTSLSVAIDAAQQHCNPGAKPHQLAKPQKTLKIYLLNSETAWILIPLINPTTASFVNRISHFNESYFFRAEIEDAHRRNVLVTMPFYK